MQNVRALRVLYGDVSNCSRFSWILVKNYQLPPYFNTKTCALLVTTPGEEIRRYDGYDFYLSKRLQRTDGKPTFRLHDEGPYNPYASRGYSRLSFHLNDFRPSSNAKDGDNFISICQSLFTFLGDARGIL